MTVVDTTDPDWWQGKCMGQVGYFPSKYVTKLFPGERPLQIINTVQLTDGEFAIKLLREQVFYLHHFSNKFDFFHFFCRL